MSVAEEQVFVSGSEAFCKFDPAEDSRVDML
jgi:hypothetical protein